MHPDQSSVGYQESVPRQSYLFSKPEPLIEHLKKFGEMIYATRTAGPYERTVVLGRVVTIGGHQFSNLPRAFLRLEDPEYQVHGFGSDEKSGFESRDSNIWVTRELLVSLNHSLHDDHGEFRKLSSWATTRSFVYIDVSDFSKAKSGHQALIINAIIKIINDDSRWNASLIHHVHKDIEAMLCIGDGYIFVFDDPVKATYFAAFLAQLIESMISHDRIVEFHFRMGVHSGRVFSFWDIGRNGWNYVGDGINGGNRVLSAIGKEADDILFISAQVRQKLIGRGESPCPQILSCLQNRGRRADKHGNPWRVYELNHSALTADDMPVDLKRS
jgi:class 3 adenylate cyclase